MEFFLIKDHLFSMDNTGRFLESNFVSRVSRGFRVDKVHLADVDGNLIDKEIYGLTLENSLVEDHGTLKSLNCDTKLNLALQVYFTLPTSPPGRPAIHVSNCRPDTPNSTNVLRRLLNVFGEPNVKVHFSVAGFGCINDDTKMDLDFKDLSITEPEPRGIRYTCKSEVDLPAAILEPLTTGATFRGRLTVIVALNHKAVNQLYLDQNPKSSLSRNLQNRELLEDPVGSDLVIVARNGAKLNCHKAFLIVSSSVFKAMFAHKTLEAATHIIEMLDMSENGVRALLKFLYYFDLEKALDSCEIALELYCAGHKYAIFDLENKMTDLMCFKPRNWFTADVAMNLLLFAKNLAHTNPRKRLLAKAVQALKWYRDNDFEQFRNSVQSQESPNLVMELADAFLTASP